MKQNILSFRKMEDDTDIRKMMQEEVQVPPNVLAAENAAFSKILSGEKYTHKKRKMAAKISWISVAAAAFIFSSVCVTNPAFAENIPGVGHVFAEIGRSIGFAGDYNKYAEPLVNPTPAVVKTQDTDSTESASVDSKYSQTSNGTTVTLSEVYCNQNALYLGLTMKTTDKIPELMKFGEGDSMKPYIYLWNESSLTTSMNKHDPWTLDSRIIDGKITDDHTFEGILRVAFSDNIPPDQHLTIPSDFTADFHFGGFGSNLASELCQPLKDGESGLYNPKTNWLVQGAWDYSLNVHLNTDDTMTKTVGDDGTCPAGPITLIKSPFDISIKYSDPDAKYWVVLVDKNGKYMDEMGVSGSIDQIAVNGYDTSTVTVYIFDDIIFGDKIKGQALGQNNVTELFNSGSLWHQEVSFR